MADESERPTEVIDLEDGALSVAPVIKLDREKELAESEVASAAKALGLVTVRIKNPIKGFKARRVIGRYLRQLGVVDVGRGQLAFAESNAGEIMAGIDEQIGQTQDAEIKLSLLKCKLEANKQIIDIGQTNIKGTSAGENGVVSSSRPPVSFPLGVPVQVNVVQSNQGATKKSE